MKKYLLLIVFVIMIISSCKKNCSDTFAGRLWYSKEGIQNSFQDPNEKSSNILIKIEKENDALIVYYYDRAGKEDVDKFIVTCDNNVLKGQYNGQNVQIGLLENGNLLLNQFEIPSARNVLKKWEQTRTDKGEEDCFNDYEHCQMAEFFIWYTIFKDNKQSGKLDFENIKKEIGKKYNAGNQGDIGFGDKDINKRFASDAINKIKANEK